MFSSELPASESAGHAIYTPSKSPTSKLLSGETWSISYGDGSSASGNVYSDNVSVGKATVTAQAVEAAKTVSAEFVSDTSDGLLGLAFDNINTVTPNQQKTFFFNAIAQGLPSPVFTANLKKGAPGNYNFGYIDTSEYTGSITYVPVTTANGFWEFTGNGYAIGSGSFVSSSIDAIADTGTTLLYLPAAAVKAYYAKVSGAQNNANAGGYIFPCSATLPSITLGIGSYKAVVPGSYINYAPYSGSCKSSSATSVYLGLTNTYLQLASVVSSPTPASGFPSTATSSSSRSSSSSTATCPSSASQPSLPKRLAKRARGLHWGLRMYVCVCVCMCVYVCIMFSILGDEKLALERMCTMVCGMTWLE